MGWHSNVSSLTGWSAAAAGLGLGVHHGAVQRHGAQWKHVRIVCVLVCYVGNVLVRDSSLVIW